MKLKNLLRFWPIAVFLLLEIILFVANYKPGTFLMGWDNVMPEFNFKANIIRNFFGVWQEHRGLGLYDGMSHAANLLHTLFLWMLSLILPLDLLRYVFTFLMHFLGGIGIYALLRHLRKGEAYVTLVALIGALFYLFNIATIHMFFTPLESFSVHFAALPWLALSLVAYLESGAKKSLIWFYITSFLATAQFFVTTLFVPISALVGVICLYNFIISRRTILKPVLKRVAIAGIGFLLINSFWLLPQIYGLPKNAPIIQAAKINQQSTPEVFARNQVFGDLKNTLLMRGFGLNSEETAVSDAPVYVMAPWRDFIDTPIALTIAFIFVALAFIGIFAAFMAGKKQYIPFAVLFFIGFFMLGNDIFGLRNLNELLRDHVPFFNEAFRFPYTKFCLLYAFASSILIAGGVSAILSFVNKISKGAVIFCLILIGAIGYISLPAWSGNFFFSSLRLKLPGEYLQVFKYMQGQIPNGRVALLPQPSFWSWKQYQWGYSGSGFLWYGLPQPTLDRAFDPWSIENENYYWELSNALYAKDSSQLETVFAKYDIRFIVLDEQFSTSTSYLAFNIDSTKEMFTNLPNIKKLEAFGKLTIYERFEDTVNEFISIKQNLPSVIPVYHSSENDVAYQKLGDYIIANGVQSDLSAMYLYPYRSLFTKRSSSEREFLVKETEDQIIISTKIGLTKFASVDFSKFTLVPSSEATGNVKVEASGNQMGAYISKQDNLVFDSTTAQTLAASAVTKCGGLRDGIIKAENMTAGNEAWLRLISSNQRACLSFGMPDVWHQDGYLLAVASRNLTGRPILFSVINQTSKHIELETYLPLNNPSQKMDWQTTYFILPPLALDGLGYTIYLANDSIGRHESINEVGHIYMYRIPYNELTQIAWTNDQQDIISTSLRKAMLIVNHPNPAFYTIKVKDGIDLASSTLVLSQSFDSGWQAFVISNSGIKHLSNHYLVNNWANGWEILSNQSGTVIIFFWPQLLEWGGFVLMLGTFIFLIFKKK
ncbi:MAG: hypothetical protein V1808_03315 [Candidatus Daviesbacteria bacterium]